MSAGAGGRGSQRARGPALLAGPRPRRKVLGWVLVVVGETGATAALLPFRSDLTPVSTNMAYLVLVVAAAATGGLWTGIAASIAGFVLLNYFFLPPYGTFVVGSAEHVVVLFVSLGLSAVIATLIATSEDRARLAEAKQEELQAISELSVTLVEAARPGRGARVLDRVVSRFSFDSGALLVRGFNAFSLAASFVGCKKNPMSAELRQAYPFPYDTWQNRIATLRFVQDIPLSPGDRNYDMVSAVSAGIDRFCDLPMAVFWGEQDFVFDCSFLAEWQRRFPGAEVHRYPDAGHYILEDAQEEIVPLIAAFLARTDGGERP